MAVGKRWVDVRYKCACMGAEAGVQIEEREVAEDVLDFMGRVQVAISQDHGKRSAFCARTTMEYAKVPAPGDRIGGGEGGTA